MEVKVPAVTKGQENCLLIASMVRNIALNYLELGGLLVENQENGYWGDSGHESFKDFIQDLGISYDWATRMMGLARVVTQQLFTKEEILDIGVSKACLLLPHVKKGKLDEETRLLARDCTFTDLRKQLGHNIKGIEDCEEYVLCRRCGSEINPINVKCGSCGEVFSVKIGMIRRR